MRYVLGALLLAAVVCWFAWAVSIETGYRPTAGCGPDLPGGVYCSDRYLGLERGK